ncbi:hypothetical protein LEMLEM_LOCUS23691, partial [Lemmus lemmus]
EVVERLIQHILEVVFWECSSRCLVILISGCLWVAYVDPRQHCQHTGALVGAAEARSHSCRRPVWHGTCPWGFTSSSGPARAAAHSSIPQTDEEVEPRRRLQTLSGSWASHFVF